MESETDSVEILVVSGATGRSLYVADHRVAGPKPWGGGTVVDTFEASREELLRLLTPAEEKPADGK